MKQKKHTTQNMTESNQDIRWSHGMCVDVKTSAEANAKWSPEGNWGYKEPKELCAMFQSYRFRDFNFYGARPLPIIKD